MDLSNLKPAVDKARVEEIVDAAIDLPLNEPETEVKLEGSSGELTDVFARTITDKEEIAKIEAKKKINNILIDAVTRQTAQIRLEACENDVTIDSVYNTRLQELMKNEDLDERGFNLAKTVLDNAFKVARNMGVPDKEDTDTIFLLAKVATGELNAREQIEYTKLRPVERRERISDKVKSKRRVKSKEARKARRKGRK